MVKTRMEAMIKSPKITIDEWLVNNPKISTRLRNGLTWRNKHYSIDRGLHKIEFIEDMTKSLFLSTPHLGIGSWNEFNDIINNPE